MIDFAKYSKLSARRLRLYNAEQRLADRLSFYHNDKRQRQYLQAKRSEKREARKAVERKMRVIEREYRGRNAA